MCQPTPPAGGADVEGLRDGDTSDHRRDRGAVGFPRTLAVGPAEMLRVALAASARWADNLIRDQAFGRRNVGGEEWILPTENVPQ